MNIMIATTQSQEQRSPKSSKVVGAVRSITIVMRAVYIF